MNAKIQLMLQQAIRAFQSGNFASADLILKKCLQVDTKNFQALHILGLIKASQSKFREAADYLARAARIQPNDASIQFNLAKALTDSGNDKDAITHHKKAVALDPNNQEAWLNYGLSTFNLGRYEDALVYYSNALRLKPDYAVAYCNKGATLNTLKRYDEAIVHYDKLISLKPDYAVAYCNKGATLNALKRYDEALTHYDEALNLKPDYAEAWANKGAVLFVLKRYDEALTHYDEALNLKPDYAEAWSNKGAVLFVLKRHEEAVAHYEKALNLKPDYAEAWSNKGVALFELKHYEEAVAHYEKALNLKPDYAEAWSNKGIALNELKRYDEALAHYNKALYLKPDIDWMYGDLVHTKMKICNWSDFLDSLEIVFKKVTASEKVTVPFTLLALTDNPTLHKKSSEIYVQDRYLFNPVLGPIPKYPKKHKIRIGYYSSDFGDHAVSILTAELFELHDRSKFEITAFSFGVNDKSPLHLRVSKAFNQFIDVNGMSDIDIAKLSRELCIDIAVDLTGHTQYARTGIFSYRVAPIQISYIGYLGTMGANYYDYIIADKTIITDNSQKFYSEKTLYLPSYQVNDRKRIISERQFTRAELGLPDTGFIFCCFNNNYKILPPTFEGWMRILNAVEGSVLFLFADNEWSKANLIKEACLCGIDSARLIFVGRILTEEYLARYRVCDLFLDTFPYNAGTTASDALWVGLPVLTLMGQSFASRMAASLLNAIGLPELITTTQEEYEALAIELANNPQKLESIKLRLAHNRLTTPLFDTPLFTKNLEAAYIKMYEES